MVGPLYSDHQINHNHYVNHNHNHNHNLGHDYNQSNMIMTSSPSSNHVLICNASSSPLAHPMVHSISQSHSFSLHSPTQSGQVQDMNYHQEYHDENEEEMMHRLVSLPLPPPINEEEDDYVTDLTNQSKSRLLYQDLNCGDHVIINGVSTQADQIIYNQNQLEFQDCVDDNVSNRVCHA